MELDCRLELLTDIEDRYKKGKTTAAGSSFLYAQLGMNRSNFPAITYGFLPSIQHIAGVRFLGNKYSDGMLKL